MSATEEKLSKIDKWLGAAVIGLFVVYLFIPNTYIGISASLLFIYWLGIDIYVAYKTKSWTDIALDALIIALIAYSIYNPQFLGGSEALTPIYVIYRLIALA